MILGHSRNLVYVIVVRLSVAATTFSLIRSAAFVGFCTKWRPLKRTLICGSLVEPVQGSKQRDILAVPKKDVSYVSNAVTHVLCSTTKMQVSRRQASMNTNAVVHELHEDDALCMYNQNFVWAPRACRTA
jgi:hypothetical protein